MGVEMKQLKTDVVVISAGTAGLPAAITAAEGGAKVIILEKPGHTGGTANRGNMLFAVESKMQKAQPDYMTKEEAFKTHMEWTHWRVDPRLVSAFINKSGSTIDWLQEEGVEFQAMRMGPPPGSGTAVSGFGPSQTAPVVSYSDKLASCTIGVKGVHTGGPRDIGSASAMAKALTSRAKELGIQFLMKTAANKIVKKGKVVTGVIAKNENGEEIRISAKAVIIATGGIGGSKELVKEYLGFEEGKNHFALQKIGLTGDGIRMAWEAGAAHTPIMVGATHNLPPPCGTSFAFSFTMRPANLMVNILGERFSSDDMMNAYGVSAIHGTAANVLAQQPGKVAFMIYDENLKKYYEEQAKKMSMRFPRPASTSFQHEDLDDNIKEAQAMGYKALFMASSLKDLSKQTGINYEGLKKTLDEYNAMCAVGKDEVFYKSPEYLKPIKGPKFYAGKIMTGDYGTAGGIKTNYKMEVLTTEFEVIPGLYAAGNDANNLYDHSYTALAGNYIGFAVNSGRMAAESALDYINTMVK